MLESSRAEHPEGDPKAPPGRVAHREGQIVDQQRARSWPRVGAMGLEHDRREDLHPVGDELAVPRHPRLAALRVSRQPPRPLGCHQCRLAIARSCAHRDERLGDPARHEPVVARGMRALEKAHRALADPASVMPGLLARQRLREAVRPVAVRGQAAIALRRCPGLP